jgi:hypothetical protein
MIYGGNMTLKKKISLAIIGYVLINRGVKREIANNITVGEDISIPSKNGTIRASLFNRVV